ncbi:hypothetical protein [Deinococcus fonticola]|uniref:hypothetical protein n=1 Tax=Deinococcus fonticola TaxID=2528713 RepID=UPI0010753A89|nr:hypothetical protein [Deinococcus fonticola]
MTNALVANRFETPEKMREHRRRFASYLRRTYRAAQTGHPTHCALLKTLLSSYGRVMYPNPDRRAACERYAAMHREQARIANEEGQAVHAQAEQRVSEFYDQLAADAIF